MTACSRNLSRLLDCYPDGEHAGKAIESILADAGQQSEFRFSDIAEKIDPPIYDGELALILSDLISHNVLGRTFRVISPSNEALGIEDFSSYNEIPDELLDEYSGQTFTITPRQVRVIYTLPDPGESRCAIE